MIKLNGNNAYFVPPKNRYGLSTNETYDLMEHDFSILVNVKIDWDKMTPETPTKQGGIVAKNGRHCGINSLKCTNGTYIQALWWAQLENGEIKERDITFKVDDNDKFMNISMLHDSKTKTMTLSVDEKSMDKIYEGEIIDYRDSWLWVGANNSLDNCEKEHRGFLIGEIQHVSIFDEVLNDIQIRKTFNAKDSEDFRDISKFTAAAFSFKEEDMTPYKVFDISLNGNHIILFDNKWMDVNTELI